MTRQFQGRDYTRHAALMILDESTCSGKIAGLFEAWFLELDMHVRGVALSTTLANAHDSVPGPLCLPVWKSTSEVSYEATSRRQRGARNLISTQVLASTFLIRASVRPVAMEAHIGASRASTTARAWRR